MIPCLHIGMCVPEEDRLVQRLIVLFSHFVERVMPELPVLIYTELMVFIEKAPV